MILPTKEFALRFLLFLFLIATAYPQNDAATQVKENDPPAEVPANARHSTFLMMGNRAGQQAVWHTDDGVTHVLFEFNDRGRGPRTVTDYRFDSQGNVVAVHTIGHDYLKSSSEETFTHAEDGTATWKNRSESASLKSPDAVFYPGMFSPPEEIAMLVRVAKAHGGTVKLLPTGEARVSKVGERTLEANGKHAHVTEYAVTGLDFTPNYLWLDDDNNFFAGGDTWAMVIREGFETAAKSLVDIQQQAQLERSRTLAKQLMHAPKTDLLIHNVSVFDSVGGKVIPGQDVLISGNRIKSIGSAASQPAAGAEVIDGTGKVLIPGLWDMHAHVGPNDGLLNLAAGVTTVRDMGNDIDDLTSRRHRIEAGDEIGTRIIPCGLIDGPGPYQGPTKILASNETEARAYVDQFASLGYPQIKIYSSVKPELVPAIVDEARKHHQRVSGHIPAGMTATQAVQDGYNEIQHANFLMLNFMPDVKNTETTARFTEVAKRGADIDLNSPAMHDFVALLQEKHISLDVTLSVFEEMFTARNGTPSPTFAPVADRLPPQVLRNSLSAGMPVPDGMDQRFRDSYANMERMVKVFYDAGIPIESGTDAIAGFAFDRELEIHQHIGIPAARILQDATLGAARIMSKDSDLGSITAGKLADAVLIEGDPTKDIGAVRNTKLVIKDGVVYYPAEIDRELGIRP